MQAGRLLKRNIENLLKARGQSQADLAEWCRRSEAWLSKILSESPENNQRREIPLKYLDRIADFFGLAPYQLFQPGITGLLERRKGERRSGKDRRVGVMNQYVRESVSNAVASLTPADLADIIRWRALSPESRQAARQTLQELELADQQADATPRARRASERRLAAAKGTGTRGQHHRTEPEERQE